MSENKGLRKVSTLFTRDDSIYATLPGVDCWPIARDARKWPGGTPVVAHPPCRAWGRMRHLANPAPGEKEAARWAVRMVRKWGGVLEHPESSTLWEDMNLPRPGTCDRHGGWTLSADQFWWGHPAQKRTWFYFVGVGARELVLPFALGDAPKIIGTPGRRKNGKRTKKRPEISKADRERTPPDLARWLVDVARRSRTPASSPEKEVEAL